RWVSIGLPASVMTASCRVSMIPSRRRATSASLFARIRWAVALSVVLVQWDLRLPPASYHEMYQGPASPRLKMLPLPFPRFDMVLFLSEMAGRLDGSLSSHVGSAAKGYWSQY